MTDVRVFTGKNKEGTSMFLLARQIADLLGGRVVTTHGQVAGATHVVTVDPSEAAGLVALRKYVPPFELTSFLGGSVLDFTEAGFAEAVLQLRCGLDHFVSHSPYEMQRVKRFVADTFSYPLREELLPKLSLVTWGAQPVEWSTVKDPDLWLAPFNRVDFTWKDIRTHHKVVAELQSIAALHGRKVRNLFIRSGIEDKPVSEFTSYEIQKQGTRAEYMEVLSRAGAFFCACKDESFGIYYLELLFSGAPGVFLDYPWVRALLPGYPFVVDKAEAVQACTQVLQNYEWTRDRIKPYVEALKVTYGFDRVRADLKKALGV